MTCRFYQVRGRQFEEQIDFKEGVLGVGEAVVRAKGNELDWDIEVEWELHMQGTVITWRSWRCGSKG